MKKLMSVRGRLITTFLFITLLQTMFIGIAAHYASYTAASNRIDETFSLALDYVCSAVDAEVKQIMRLSDYLFIDNMVKDAMSNISLQPETFYQYDNKVYNILNEYALSHTIDSLNSISLNNYSNDRINQEHTIRYKFKYYDISSEALFPIDADLAAMALQNPSQCFWSPVSTRTVNPVGVHPFSIRDITLYRAVKDKKYKESIGLMRISIEPESFLTMSRDYLQNYSSFASQCEILLLNNYGEYLSPTSSAILEHDILLKALLNKQVFSLSGLQLEDRDYTVYARSVKDAGWNVIGILPKTLLQADSTYVYQMSLIGSFAGILISSLTYLVLSVWIIKPILRITECLKRIGKGETYLRIPTNKKSELGQLCRDINVMLDRIQELNQIAVHRQLELQEAQFRVYQEQINPHFVGNTLNAIKWLVETSDVEKTRAAIEAFSQITRYTSDRRTVKTTVRQELAIAERYAYLQKLAHPGKFTVVWAVQDKVNEASCLKFFLQPLLENAILHAACPQQECVDIYVSIYAESDQLFINVYDNGVGMSADRLESIRNDLLLGSMGIQNIRKRLNLLYGEQCKMEIDSEIGQYTSIVIYMPLEYSRDRSVSKWQSGY